MTAIVVGASRGLGRGVAAALVESGAQVVGVSRTAAALPPVATVEIADATEAAAVADLLERYDPDAVILVAGAAPALRPLQEQTWETFGVNWEADVRIAFHWLRETLTKPLRPGSRVVVFSSGAALAGSPLSGGYAGAKATQRFITQYARDEAARAGLGITFTSVLPRLTPYTDLGRPAVEAYATRAGLSEKDYLRRLGPPVTPEIAGAAVLQLLKTDDAALAPAHLLTGNGLQPLDEETT